VVDPDRQEPVITMPGKQPDDTGRCRHPFCNRRIASINNAEPHHLERCRVAPAVIEVVRLTLDPGNDPPPSERRQMRRIVAEMLTS